MNDSDLPPPDAPDGSGATTSPTGTAYPVDFTRDRRAFSTWALFVGGPVIWFLHFMVVYLGAEAGCTGDGPGLELFDPPITTAVTIVATVVTTLACVPLLIGNLRRWREGGDGEDDRRETHRSMAAAGLSLTALSALTIVAVGVSAVVFPGC